MQYLSPPPSSATYSPTATPQAYLPTQQQQPLAVITSSQPTLPIPAPTSPGRAVVIGINYFNQKGEMHHRVDEARNLARYLTQIKHYPAENIMLLTDDQNGPNGQPTKRNILGALFWLARNAREGEKLVLYYSGHGRVATAKKRRGKGAGAKGKGKAKAQDEDQQDPGTNKGAEDEEEGDGLETIYPVDFRSFKEGMIRPAELQEILKPARDVGAKLTIILDAHTGKR
jgi:metacaspase-1